MALDQRLRVIFTRVDVVRQPPRWGPSEWSFRATVAGEQVGNPDTVFPAERRVPIDLPDEEWTREVDVAAAEEVQVEFAATARREEETSDLGRVRLRLRFPFSQREELLRNRYFAVAVRVELRVAGGYGPHGANDIFACREVSGQQIWTTVSGRRFVTRLEFCEVRPVPADASMPRRPNQPGGLRNAVRNGSGRRRIAPDDPINFIQNPSVIPLLPSAEADANTAACIEYTYYQPSLLNFTNDDDRLQWTVRSLADGGQAAFVGAARGLRIHVNGTHEGEVLLECRMEGVLLATYRALVRRMRNIVCRFNILNGPAGAVPRSMPENVRDHMRIANIFLRQAGIQLVLDTNAIVTDGAVASDIPGIFRISVPAGRTSGVSTAGFPACTLMNYREGVLNFAYIHSDAGGFLGMATDIPANTLGTSVQDNGTPSTSWKRPSGIAPDAAAGTITMRMFDAKQRAAHPRLFAMYVTDANGSPTGDNSRLTYAGTIAHELGHILALRHRVGAGDDRIRHPWSQNLMHGDNPSTIAQDLDIIQARAIHGSPLLS
ncbi:MAG: hypothetical protein FJW35_01760 [Acidobacteria bacterium]|nr:hypothetical protein [Acidobacteriota bacterium]